MTYNNKLKINNEFFDNQKTFHLSEQIILNSINDEILDGEAYFYFQNSNYSNVKEYLPNAFPISQDDAKVKLQDFLYRGILKTSILYTIRIMPDGYPIGYININTPANSDGLDSWSLDFWINPKFQGKNIITVSILSILKHLKEFGVKEVKAIVHISNMPAIKVLEKTNFQIETKNISSGKEILLYRILNKL